MVPSYATLSPVQNVKCMENRIPNCQATYLPDTGYLLLDKPDVVNGVCEVILESESFLAP